MKYDQKFSKISKNLINFHRLDDEFVSLINSLLSNQFFEDKLKVIHPIHPWLLPLFEEDQVIYEDVMLKNVVGISHGSYDTYRNWSEIFTHLKRLRSKKHLIQYPERLFNDHYISNNGSPREEDILFYKFNNKYYVKHGMHRTTIAKYSNIPQLCSMPVIRIHSELSIPLLEFLANKKTYVNKSNLPGSSSYSLYKSRGGNDNYLKHFDSRSEMINFLVRMNEYLMKNDRIEK